MKMTLGGYSFMIVSWAVIAVVFTYCMIRTLKGRFK